MIKITNGLLKQFIIDFHQTNLFDNDIESKECQEIDEINQDDATREAFAYCLSDEHWNYFRNIIPKKEKKVLWTYRQMSFYINKRDELQHEIKKQINQCDQFLKTDMCKRNTILEHIIKNEKEKLTRAINCDLVSLCITGLNSFFTRLYPRMSKLDRAVKISEALHYLEIHKNTPYMTKSQAIKHASEIGEKDYRKVIYGRIKKYMK